MRSIRLRPGIIQIQILVWAAALLITFFSFLPMDGFTKSLISTLVNTSIYAIIIYGNILFLYPRFYQKGKIRAYVLAVILFLTATGLLRGYSIIVLDNIFIPEHPRPLGFVLLIYYISAGVLVFILSLIFRVAIAYFTLKQQAEKVMLEKSRAELNLLKSQVQPHFLFNTLNNIYYEAFRESPYTASLIERLSDIMRYFVDESPKDTVSIGTEVDFIENYISLEKIRIRHEVDIQFIRKFEPDLRIPPMLFMTFVENIFKHGINKSSLKNRIEISLLQENGYLIFLTRNKIFDRKGKNESSGFGIENLRKRLGLLYPMDFELNVGEKDNFFMAVLKIPVS
jgi:sensor histidine kinase YesM